MLPICQMEFCIFFLSACCAKNRFSLQEKKEENTPTHKGFPYFLSKMRKRNVFRWITCKSTRCWKKKAFHHNHLRAHIFQNSNSTFDHLPHHDFPFVIIVIMIAITPFLLVSALVCQGKKEGSLIPHLGLEKHLRVNYDFPHRIKELLFFLVAWLFLNFWCLSDFINRWGKLEKISPFWHDEHDIKQSWGISFLSFFSEYFCGESACCSNVPQPWAYTQSITMMGKERWGRRGKNSTRGQKRGGELRRRIHYYSPQKYEKTSIQTSTFSLCQRRWGGRPHVDRWMKN